MTFRNRAVLGGVAWLGLLAGAGLSAPAPPVKQEARLKAARDARRAGRLDEFNRKLKEYQADGGDAETVRLERALAQAQQGDVAPVEKDLVAVLAKKDRTVVPLVLEALTRGKLAALELAEANAYLKKWLAVEPADAQGYFLRARAQETLLGPAAQGWSTSSRGAPPDALSDYRRALKLNPQHDGARLKVAEQLLETGKVHEALPHFEALCKTKPVRPEARLGLVRCQVALGKLDEAGRLLDALLAADPNYAAALVERGRLDMQSGRLAQAMASVRRALTIQPHDKQAVYLLFVCLRQGGRPAEAKAFQDRLKRILADRNRLERLQTAMLDKPADAVLRSEMGSLLLRLGQTEQGVRWLHSALKQDPRHKATHKALADYYEQAGRKEQAAHHRRLARE
jgi:tetratricopeptide (TPR) repeat protein